ncbi:ABC transporter permease subunit [bacterium]|nr:ABC transporter permease subunit [bacterium]
MNDQASPAPSPAAPSSATPSATPAPVHARADTGRGKVDWSGMLPETLGGIVLDVLKLAVFWAIVANWYAIAHGAELTTKIKVCALGVSAVLVLLWKVYLALLEAVGTPLLGATYLVLGAGACGLVEYFAQTAIDVSESTQTRSIVRVLGLVFLYPAALGAMALKDGKVAESLNPIGLPVRPSWFQTLWILYAKEVRTFFTTAIPYIVFAVFMVLNGLLFFALVRYVSDPKQEISVSAGRIVFENFVFWISLIVICPALTMRLVAEEKRLGTIETLLTAPVTDVQVILGKFGAAMTFYATMLATTLAYIVILAQYSTEWDWGPIFSAYLGAFLMGGFLISIGTAASTITDSQLVAFIVGVAINILLYAAQLVSSYATNPTLKTVSHYLCFTTHCSELNRGLVSTRDLIFFGTSIFFFLFAAVRGLESQKWK